MHRERRAEFSSKLIGGGLDRGDEVGEMALLLEERDDGWRE